MDKRLIEENLKSLDKSNSEGALEHNQLKEWLLDYKNLKSKEAYYRCIERLLGMTRSNSSGQSLNSHLTKEDIDDILDSDCGLDEDTRKDLMELKKRY